MDPIRRLAMLLAVPAFLAGVPGAPGAGPLDPSATDPAPDPAPRPSAWSLEGGLTMGSRYLFQGQEYSDGRAVLLPDLTASYRGLSLNVWSSYQLEPGVFTEVDLGLSYGREVGGLELRTGYVELRYPHRGWEPSREFVLDAALDAPLDPALTVHYDFAAGQGTYSTLGLAFSPWGPLALAARLFYQDHYYEMTGVPALELEAGIAVPTRAGTLTPSVSYDLAWPNGDFTDAEAIPDRWVLALGLSREF